MSKIIKIDFGTPLERAFKNMIEAGDRVRLIDWAAIEEDIRRSTMKESVKQNRRRIKLVKK